jgi:hypothetical protein
MEMQSLKEVFFQNEDYTLEIEKLDNAVGLHCIVHNWSLSSLKHGYRKVAELMNILQEQGYDYMFTITPNPKFAKLFGGETKHKLTYNNEEYEVVIWELK